MGFCTEAEYESFMTNVPLFEDLLVRSGIRLLKYYLDIDRDEQKKRLALRERDPLKQWKIRSEEHTSEIQSLMRISYAVFCLKKKIQDSTQNTLLYLQIYQIHYPK